MTWIDTLTSWYESAGILARAVDIAVILLIAFVLDKLLCHWLNRAVRHKVAKGENNRRLTLYSVMRSVIHYVIVFVALVMILTTLGINVASILAAAGVIGLAVSFGAQSLVKDIFAGFFIIFEDQYGVGEYVTINRQFTGFVEVVGLRTTQLKGDNGELIIIPNGSITDVINLCRFDLRVKELFEIALDADIDAAEDVIAAAAAAYYGEHQEQLTKAPSVEGVEVIGKTGVSICLVTYTTPMSRWSVGRDLRKTVIQALHNAGIPMPPYVLPGVSGKGER